MEWLDKINSAIDYMEAHMEKKMDYQKAAKIACCSLSGFQRMFTFATDITLSEYVRCRRMALSAYDFIHGDEKVVEVALKYGYESAAAFTRAFQTFHGVPPTAVRKLGIYTEYPRITLEIKVNGGSLCMSTKPIVRIEEHGNERLAGFFVNCKAPEEAAWNMLRKWSANQLKDYPARRYIGCAPKGHHPEGEEHQADETDIVHEYLAYVFLFEEEGRENTFKGAEVYDGPKGLFLVGDVALNEFRDDGTIDIGGSMMKAYGVMSEFLKETSAYEFDMGARPYYEEHVFTKEWFETGGEMAGFKLWLPIKKLSECS